MIYLDTGCLVKLYYPEPDSQKVVTSVLGKQICLNPLHEVEFTAALHLKVFHRVATPTQAQAAQGLLEEDLKSGLLFPVLANWEKVFRQATLLAGQYTGIFGCRSLDILHCAAAKVLEADEFLTTDLRPKQLAGAMGLNLVNL